MEDEKGKCPFCTYKNTCKGEEIVAAFVATVDWKFLWRHIKRTKSVKVLSAADPKRSKEVSCAPELTLITSYLKKQLRTQ